MSRGNRHRHSAAMRAATAAAKQRAQERAAEKRTAAARLCEERDAQLRASLVSIGIAAYAVPDGDSGTAAVELLAALAWCLTLGTAIAVHVGHGSPEARRLHGSLRQVQALCLAGYRWRTELAPALHAAAQEASAITMRNQDLVPVYVEQAMYFAGKVQNRVVTADDVVGAELYNQPQQDHQKEAT